jgi:hypothetical protein
MCITNNSLFSLLEDYSSQFAMPIGKPGIYILLFCPSFGKLLVGLFCHNFEIKKVKIQYHHTLTLSLLISFLKFLLALVYGLEKETA